MDAADNKVIVGKGFALLHHLSTPLLTPGEHVAIHPPGGAPGNPRNSHGSGHLHTDGGDRSFQSGGGTDSGHQIQVVVDVGGTLHSTELDRWSL